MKKKYLILFIIAISIVATLSFSSCASQNGNYYFVGTELEYIINATADDYNSESGVNIQILLDKGMANKINPKDIILSDAFENMSVLSCDKANELILLVTIKGDLKRGYQYGTLSINGSTLGLDFNPTAEIAIEQAEFCTYSAIDRFATEHKIIIEGNSLKETVLTDNSIVLSGALEGLSISDYKFGDGLLELTINGIPNANLFGYIELSPECAGFYNGAIIIIDIIEPDLSIYNGYLDIDNKSTIYLNADEFDFNDDISIDDVELIFESDELSDEEQSEELKKLIQYVKITDVKNVFGVLAITLDIDSAIYDLLFNPYNNIFLLNIKESGTTLTRDISCELWLPAVYCDYDVEISYEEDYAILEFYIDIDGGVFNKELQKNNITISENNGKDDIILEDAVVDLRIEKGSTLYIKVKIDKDGEGIVYVNIPNAIKASDYNAIYSLNLSFIYAIVG